MAETRLNKHLYTDISKLKLCNKSDAPVRFLLDKSPFTDIDDDDADAMAEVAKSNEYLIIGRIFPQSDIYKEGAYQIEIKLTKTFPSDPPEVRFITPIYHPNVDKDGNIKIKYLN
jgi:ubiquitin-protein ligase